MTSERVEVVTRITEYLSLGGLWNPDLMDHDKVRDLLIDCREALTTAQAAIRLAEAVVGYIDAHDPGPAVVRSVGLDLARRVYDESLAAYRQARALPGDEAVAELTAEAQRLGMYERNRACDCVIGFDAPDPTCEACGGAGTVVVAAPTKTEGAEP